MVSSCDKTLLYRVFQHSHSISNPLYYSPAGDVHYMLSISFQIAQSGVFALTCLNMRRMFRHWCKICSLCTRKGLWLDKRGFTSGPEDPRLVSVLGQECLGSGCLFPRRPAGITRRKSEEGHRKYRMKITHFGAKVDHLGSI